MPLSLNTRLSARIVALTILAFVSAAAPSAAQHGPEDPARPLREYSTAPVGAAGAGPWRSDLRALVAGLEAKHPDPYWRTPESRLDSAVAALHADIPGLAAHEIIVGFARIAAMVGDGHTSIPLHAARGVDFHVLPYRLGVYEGGLYVEAADRRYASLVGGRVVAIGGVAAERALSLVAPLISRDNDNWIAAVAPNLLNRMEVLHALGLASGLEGVEVSVRVEGRDHSEWVAPLAKRHPQPFGLPFLPELTDDWVDARDAARAPVPLYQRRFDDVYWWEYLPSDDLLYIKWDQVRNRDHGPSALATFREALEFGRERRPARTVIDIRNNTGGEGGLLPAIVREIVRSREIDEPGRLFLVIGRRTFSAGQMLTADLERLSTAILVGEPSSAFYNGYAGHVFVPLPETGIGLMVSPSYYQMGLYPGDPRQQATPRLAAVPTFDDYRSNRDPALEAILDYEPGALARDVAAAIAAGDTARAAALVREHDARPVNRFQDGSTELNSLGYRLLREGKTADALALFRLNVRVHPAYVNGWDSLGEAYVAAGRRDEAVAAFRRALELDPGFAPAREWLRRLEQPGP